MRRELRREDPFHPWHLPSTARLGVRAGGAPAVPPHFRQVTRCHLTLVRPVSSAGRRLGGRHPASSPEAEGYRYAATSAPRRPRQARTCATSSSSASTSGRRRPPTSCPSRFSAALIAIGFETILRRSYAGAIASFTSRARST